jgi:flagellar biogenesis protein FliO
MAHRPPRTTAGTPGAALRRLVPPLVLRAVGDEVVELLGLARRLLPTRGRKGIVGLALIALVAAAGIAGAAEPAAANRSALEAWSGSAAPSTPAAAGPGASAAVPGAAPAATSPTLADDPAFQGPNLLDLGAKTLLVVALLFITLRVMRRVQGSTAPKAGELLAVLETRPLGPKTQLHLVAIGDRRLVIGQSPAGLVALGELDAAELPATEPVREPWARRDALDDDPALEAAMAHEIATGRRARVEVTA